MFSAPGTGIHLCEENGIRDHRGGGRASGRETAARVAAGAVARKLLLPRGDRGVRVHGGNWGGIAAAVFSGEAIASIACVARPAAAARMETRLDEARRERRHPRRASWRSA